MSKPAPTQSEMLKAYLSGAASAKRGFARIPPHFDTSPLFDRWLRGYDHYKFTHQGSTKK
jgi:hypothetical protein